MKLLFGMVWDVQVKLRELYINSIMLVVFSDHLKTCPSKQSRELTELEYSKLHDFSKSCHSLPMSSMATVPRVGEKSGDINRTINEDNVDNVSVISEDSMASGGLDYD